MEELPSLEDAEEEPNYIKERRKIYRCGMNQSVTPPLNCFSPQSGDIFDS